MKSKLLLFIVLLSLISGSLSGCNSNSKDEQPPFSSQVSGDSYPLRALTWNNGKLAWSSQEDILQLHDGGYYYAESFLSWCSPGNLQIVSEHYLNHISEIADSVRKTGSSVQGVIGWHERYYLAEKTVEVTVYLHELGVQPILKGRVRYDDFIRAANNFCQSVGSEDLVSGGNGLSF